jgi:hypothetical protein
VIAHVVLFRPRAELAAADAQALGDALGDAFARALEDIPFVRRARVGRRLMIGRDYERMMAVDYQYAAVLEFDDAAGLKGYLEHPAHEELGRRLFESIESVLVYDFEMVTGTDGLADLLGRRDGV